jgi:hypothetical protein
MRTRPLGMSLSRLWARGGRSVRTALVRHGALGEVRVRSLATGVVDVLRLVFPAESQAVKPGDVTAIGLDISSSSFGRCDLPAWLGVALVQHTAGEHFGEVLPQAHLHQRRSQRIERNVDEHAHRQRAAPPMLDHPLKQAQALGLDDLHDAVPLTVPARGGSPSSRSRLAMRWARHRRRIMSQPPSRP